MSERTTKNDLVAFAGPIFDLILRLKAGIVAPSNDLRPQVAALLMDFEKRAERYRFNHKIVQVSKFALASFVDETVLTNNFHLKEEWEKIRCSSNTSANSWREINFSTSSQAMLKQIEQTADAVEIYYVCMLLGFKGRYGVYEQEKLLAIMQTTANALVKVGKIKPVELSPHWLGERPARAAGKTRNAGLGKNRRGGRSRFSVYCLSGDVSDVVEIFAGRDEKLQL
jgi:type VI secretion system protein ImpK